MIKLSRKISAWILVFLMTMTSVLLPLIVKRLYRNGYEVSTSVSFSKSEVQTYRDSLSESLGDTNQYVEHETIRFNVNSEVVELFATKINLEDSDVRDYSLLSCYNAILANYDFENYPISDSFLSFHALVSYIDINHSLCNLNTDPFSERDNAWYELYRETTDSLDLAKQALFNHDCHAMAILVEDQGSSLNGISPDIWQRIATIDPYGKLSLDDGMQIVDALEQCKKYKNNLAMEVDEINGSYVPLTIERKTQIENSLLILDYQITNNKLPTNRAQVSTLARQFSQKAARFLLIILLIIIAGSSISQEMATGSIKSLIIAPVKRWKIFVAKLMAIFTWMLAGSVLITTLSTLSTSVCLGASNLLPYYYVSGGHVRQMPHIVFAFLYFLVDNISLFVYILTAFMISCLTKNTGISVGVSTGLVLSNGITSTIMDMMNHQTWIDFLPFSNLDLSGKIFPYLRLIGYMNSGEAGPFGVPEYNTLPLSFSLVYLAVLVVILLLTAYDGFNRRDIQ